jgi:hypothetical protein
MAAGLGRLRESLLPADGGGLTEGQLLGQYVARRDGAAFAATMSESQPSV